MEMGAHSSRSPSHAWGTVPQQYPAQLPPGVKCPTHRKGQGWVPRQRALACPQGPCGSALAPGLCSETSLSAQNPQQRDLHGCPRCHSQPHCKLAAAPLWLFGDRNSAAKEKFNLCRGSPCSRLRKTETRPSATEPHAEEEKSLGMADKGKRERTSGL